MVAASVNRGILVVAAAVVAVAVLAIATTSHLRSACIEQDTPYLPLCSAPSPDPSVERGELKQRLARNPGDASAWTQLLVTSPPTETEAVLPGAVLAAPHDPNVARWEAAEALQKGQLEKGVALLVDILRHTSSPESAQVLAQIAVAPKGFTLLRPHLGTAAEWLPQVLSASNALKQAPGDMLPLVAGAQQQNTLPDETLRYYMRVLKSSGQWLDAYGLWVASHKNAIPLLYNAGFDEPLEPDGFDWEFTPVPRSRAGLVIDQEAVARRGLVLDIDFTGRPFPSPIVRQYLFLAPGTYRLHAEYAGSKLRSDEGLAWAVQCTGGRKAVVGRSPALRDTGNVWKPMEFEFTIPADCGPVASLQFEPVAAYESTTGLRGSVSLDAFSLTQTAASE